MSLFLSPIVAAWHRLLAALWLVPALIVTGSVVLAFVLVLTDPYVGPLEALSPRLFRVTADGGKDVLAAIAMSMLSVAGLVFTITIATLTLTSQQFTSRVLRTFVRDRGNQIVLGVFLGAFAYSLIVLRSIQEAGDGVVGFAPQLAILVAIAFALLGVAVLIYFINHVATSIQASSIVSRVSGETIDVLRREQDRLSVSPGEQERWESAPGTLPVLAARGGYVREIDLKAIGRRAEREGWRVRAEVRIGAFVVQGQPLLSFLDQGRGGPTITEKDAAALRRAVALGPSGDIRCDPSYGVRQLVDIALKALSPSINDTTTAVTCVDYLAAVLVEADLYARSNAVWIAEDGIVRAFMRGVSFENLLDQAMNQIRDDATDNITVLLRQVRLLQHLEERVTDPDRRRQLAGHAQLILDAGERGLSSPHERRMLTIKGGDVIARLQGGTTALAA